VLFVLVGVLVFGEVDDLDIAGRADAVAEDEAAHRQFVQQGIAIAFVIGEEFGLDALGPVLQPPRAVSQTPQSNERQTGRI